MSTNRDQHGNKELAFMETVGGEVISIFTGKVVLTVCPKHMSSREYYRAVKCVLKALNREFPVV